MKKAGIIRCFQTEDLCAGTTDFVCAREGKGAFKETGPVEVVGFATCGGCPGKKAVPRARMMVEKGAEIIVLSSCISKGNPIQYPCLHFAAIREAVEKALAGKAVLIDWTH